MADGIAPGVVEALMDLAFGGTSYAGNSSVYVQLHVGLPGAAGTANVAGNSTRVITGTLTAASNSSGTVTKSNEAIIAWTSVSTSETYTHATLWTASSSGTFLGSGAITTDAVNSGDDWSIPIGDLVITLNAAN